MAKVFLIIIINNIKPTTMKNYLDIPFINLSKDNLKLAKNLLTKEQAGEILFAIYNLVYEGIEPEFTDKATAAVWSNVVDTIDRKAQGYFKKVEAGRNKLKEINDNRKKEKETPQVEEVKQEESFSEQEFRDIYETIEEKPVKTMDPESVPSNIVELFTQRPLHVSSMFDKTSRLSEQERLNRWYSLCEEFNIDPSEENKRLAYNYYKYLQEAHR